MAESKKQFYDMSRHTHLGHAISKPNRLKQKRDRRFKSHAFRSSNNQVKS